MKSKTSWVRSSLAASVLTLGILGCGGDSLDTPAGAVVGRSNRYDYSPSAIQTGSLRQFWWCGDDNNPTNPDQYSDTIQYQSIDQVSNIRSQRTVALAETKGTWDAYYLCNAHVVKGVFTNPLGDGQSFTFEMFYVATAQADGNNNSIGAAFSNDGVAWQKYKDPIILSTTLSGYGVAQPVPYNRDGKSGIDLFYEDSQPIPRHILTTSNDGIHFTEQGVLTTTGLDLNSPNPSWGDMGYDPSTGFWYALFNLQPRDPATTGGLSERGQYAVELYRIPNSSLLSGSTPWERLKIIDTSVTGFENNFIAGLLHDQYGNINIGPYPNIQVYLSASNPATSWDASEEDAGKSADVRKWDIVSYIWMANEPSHPLTRYRNSSAYETTTGWIDSSANFLPDQVLGNLYDVPQNGAATPFYGCKAGSKDYFLSADSACEGQRILGTEGYGFAGPDTGKQLVGLYACTKSVGVHFASKDPQCEGSGAGTLLGYALPPS